MIRVDRINKSFNGIQAARGISFAAEDGKITALLGPNGAGKSTTLRILATVLAADSGTAYVDAHEVKANPMAVRSQIGVLPHASGLYARLTARENILYFGQLHGMGRTDLRRRLNELIELLEMQEFCDRRVAGFSQGQKIKVALARALIHNPKNIILDEPTNGLDVMATRALRNIILHLKDEGRCVLFSSHIMQEVANLGDNVVVIGHGRVLFTGTLERLSEHAEEADLEEAFIKVIEAEESP
jgi:sodium transport system ATP-binding protein